MLIKKEQSMLNVMFGHALVIADIGKMKIRNIVRKACTDRGRIILLKDLKIRKRFDEKVIKSVDIGVSNLWDISRMELLRHVMTCVGEEKEKYGGRMKRRRWQLQKSEMHIKRCVGTILRSVRGGIKE